MCLKKRKCMENKEEIDYILQIIDLYFSGKQSKLLSRVEMSRISLFFSC